MGKFFRKRTESNPDLYCKSGLNHCLPSFDKEKTLVRRGQFFLNKTFISCISFIKKTCLKKFCKKVTFRLPIACHKYNSIQPKDTRKDFRARMQEDSADSAYRADDDTVPEESSQSSALPPLSTEARTIDYKGSVSVDWLTASSDAIYLLSRERDGGSGILKMKPGEADGEVLQVTAPDGMVFSVMTTDEQGNLYVVAEDRDIEAVMRDDEVVCPTEHCEVWRVSPSGEVAAKLDISEYVKQEVFSPRMIAVAGNGDIYLSTQNDGTAVLAFDAEGNFLNKISYDYKVYTLRTAMGRGRDGKVYAVLWDSIANDGTSVIVELDGRNGGIGDVTSFLLHSDGSFYSCVCPGRDCDLVIFGGQGILGYDLGSASIKWKVPAGELPFSTEGYFPMATLPDGRVLFLDRNYKWDEDDPTNMWVVAEGTKFHYVPAARQ